jgi:hypothetical protein
MRNINALTAKAKTHKVFTVAPGIYRVFSGNPQTQGEYFVAVLKSGKAACTCPYGAHKEFAACSHTLAALRVHHSAYISARPSKEAAAKSKRRVIDTADGIFYSLIPVKVRA